MIKVKTRVDISFIKISLLLIAVYAFASGVKSAGIIAAFILADLIIDKENSNRNVVSFFEVVSFIAMIAIVVINFI
jgi:hypothetical protein